MRTATYCKNGLGSSPAAYRAEVNGRLPLSRAIPAVAHFARCSRKIAKAALLESFDGEWHHTSKYANATKFFSVKSALKFIGLGRIEARLPEKWQEQLMPAFQISDCAERVTALKLIWVKLAKDVHCSPESLKNIYYGCYETD